MFTSGVVTLTGDMVMFTCVVVTLPGNVVMVTLAVGAVPVVVSLAGGENIKYYMKGNFRIIIFLGCLLVVWSCWLVVKKSTFSIL